MKKFTFFLLATILMGTVARAQIFDWAKSMGGNGALAYGESIAVDGAGNIYSTGYTGNSGTIDLDPGPGTFYLSAGYMYVQKLDSNGNFLWAKGVGVGGSYGFHIAVSSSGSVYLTGAFQGTQDFDPGPGQHFLSASTIGGVYNIFILKLDNSGNFVWADQMVSTTGSNAFSITLDASSNVYTTGWFQGTVDFNPDSLATYYLSPSSTQGMFVQKLDSIGSFLWAREVEANCNSIQVDNASNVYLTGNFSGTVDFDPGPSTSYLSTLGPNFGAFIEKLDPSGNYLWAKQISGNGNAHVVGYSIAVDNLGNVYTTGWFSDTADFDPGSGTTNLISNPAGEIYVEKLDGSGNFVWAKNMNGYSSLSGSYGQSIATDASNNIYIFGNFRDTIDFDPGPSVYNLISAGSQDIFLQKLDVVGNFIWVKQIGGISDENASSVFVDPLNNIYTTGSFQGVVDFNPDTSTFNITAIGSVDAFVEKLTQINTIITLPVIFNYPSFTLNKSTLDTGQTLTISGNHFSPSSAAQVNMISQLGSQSLSQYLLVNSDSTFIYNFKIPDTLIVGFYNLSVADTARNYTSSRKKINIKHPIQQQSASFINILSPTSNDYCYAGGGFNIEWSDVFTNKDPLNTNISGNGIKTYKLEYSVNGGNWQIIDTYNGWGPLYNSKTFTYWAGSVVDGSYRIRISNTNRTTDYQISDAFNVLPAPGTGIIYNTEWDYSGPKPNTPPIGVCADGTARIYLKINSKSTNSKTISKVKATLSDPTLSIQDPALVGKLMVATLRGYSLEANNANATSITCTKSVNGDYLFWYVAPDDFDRGLGTASGPDYFNGKRKVQISFLITYKDNSSESLDTSIEIVRPPLMLVHGLGGDENTWNDFKYSDINSIAVPFNISRTKFMAGIQINKMQPHGKFLDNAILLVTNNNYSFQKCLNTARFSNLYAANRVDYVCHSMGGSMLRMLINHFPDRYYGQDNFTTYKNYEKGFVNKLITLNTPHNGTPIADWISDVSPYLTWGDCLKISTVPIYVKYLKDYVIPVSPIVLGVPSYAPTDAVSDLRSFTGGVTFKETLVKNHLIGGNINNTSKPIQSFLNEFLGSEIEVFVNILFSFDLSGSSDAENYIVSKSPYPDFYVNSDLIVPLSSEFAGNLTFSSTTPRSIFYGFNKNHLDIHGNLDVGDRVFKLLNTPISSPLFADNIPANITNPNGTLYKTSNTPDSTVEYFDTFKVQLVHPIQNATVQVDSTVNVQVNLKDTVNLKKVLIYFQGGTYTSISHATNQTFTLQINPDCIDSQLVVAAALYDSVGFRVYHYAINKVVVQTDNLPLSLNISPISKYLNFGEGYIPLVNGSHNSYTTTISLNSPHLSISIADTNVIRFDTSLNQFVAKDSGSTYVIFSYFGLKDTTYFYILGDTLKDHACNPPLANFSSSFISGNCPLQVDFYDSSSVTSGASWLWTFFRGNDTITSSQKNPIGIIYSDAGSYSVMLQVTDSCGTDTKLVDSFITITCATNPIDSSLLVYPNPAKGLISIRGYKIENGKYSILIIDLFGKEVLRTEIIVSNNYLDTQIPLIIPTGVYLLTIIGEEVYKKYKVIKL